MDAVELSGNLRIDDGPFPPFPSYYPHSPFPPTCGPWSLCNLFWVFFLVLQVRLPSSRQTSLMARGSSCWNFPCFIGVGIWEPKFTIVFLDCEKAGLSTLRNHHVLNERCPILRRKRRLLQVYCKKVCPPPQVDLSATCGVPWEFK